MKRIKKILSVMLSLVMLTSVLPLTTFASEENASNLQVAMSDGGSCIMEQDGNSTEYKSKDYANGYVHHLLQLQTESAIGT